MINMRSFNTLMNSRLAVSEVGREKFFNGLDAKASRVTFGGEDIQNIAWLADAVRNGMSPEAFLEAVGQLSEPARGYLSSPGYDPHKGFTLSAQLTHFGLQFATTLLFKHDELAELRCELVTGQNLSVAEHRDGLHRLQTVAVILGGDPISTDFDGNVDSLCVDNIWSFSGVKAHVHSRHLDNTASLGFSLKGASLMWQMYNDLFMHLDEIEVTIDQV